MLSWLPILGPAIQILGFMLKWWGASEATIEQYKKLVKETQNDGLISIRIKNKILTQREEILAEIEKEKADDSKN